jgi:hypothetical protein
MAPLLAEMRLSLACIRTALDNAAASAIDADRRAWLVAARAEEDRMARLLDCRCTTREAGAGTRQPVDDW